MIIKQRILHECSCIIEFIKRVGENDKTRGLAEHLTSFPNKLNKFNNTRARMQDSIYHMTLKSHFIRLVNFALKRRDFGLRKRDVLWTSTHNLHI